LLSKGIYPALAILFAVYVYWTNTDKQDQIDRLRTEMNSGKEHQQAAERKHKQQVQQAEEQAHRMRVEFCKGVWGCFNIGNSPIEEQASLSIKAGHALRCACLEMQDRERLAAR
jgi:hypothetical protein